MHSIPPASWTERPIKVNAPPLEKSWIDYNGHLNMAFYLPVFDLGLDEMMEKLGYDDHHRKNFNRTIFAAEAHLCYLKEVFKSDELSLMIQLLDLKDRAAHCHQILSNQYGEACATCETLFFSIDTTSRKPAPFETKLFENLQAIWQGHAQLPQPIGAGRNVNLKNGRIC